jgi:hypothetical protein
MNKKGEAISVGFWSTAFILSVISLSPGVRDSFQIRSALEGCKTDVCHNMVHAMTKEERLDLIRDDKYLGNGGNFVKGYMNELEMQIDIDIE